jgi:hypothetical protein
MHARSLRALALAAALAALSLPAASGRLLAAGAGGAAAVQLADASLAQSFVGRTLNGSWTAADHPEWGAAASTLRIDSLEGSTAKISYSFKGKSSTETGALTDNRIEWRWKSGSRMVLALNADGTIAGTFFNKKGEKSVAEYR